MNQVIQKDPTVHYFFKKGGDRIQDRNIPNSFKDKKHVPHQIIFTVPHLEFN